MTGALTVSAWQRREPPLPAGAVLATGQAVAGLAARTRLHPAVSRLRACAASGWLLVLGAQADLPWAPQVRYVGWEADVLLPTALRPDLPAELVAREALHRCREELVVVLPDALLGGPLPRRPVDPDRLRALETAR
ncbi:hypothetical protein CS0771_46080 [Catellatospora sp. IY07-71]|uniref:bpX5 domain-containing protein n=1 Tax=Catellatospora sp. IY07-71 TaxID=2728827 RepID=UPI001BB31469|nr:hypothetical protein [Catellatospora sp. IY07-71]BCJ75064.1 hypothetical protein CS0771_46080 [Catellatospora sp. IY07-71]